MNLNMEIKSGFVMIPDFFCFVEYRMGRPRAACCAS